MRDVIARRENANAPDKTSARHPLWCSLIGYGGSRRLTQIRITTSKRSRKSNLSCDGSRVESRGRDAAIRRMNDGFAQSVGKRCLPSSHSSSPLPASPRLLNARDENLVKNALTHQLDKENSTWSLRSPTLIAKFGN